MSDKERIVIEIKAEKINRDLSPDKSDKPDIRVLIDQQTLYEMPKQALRKIGDKFYGLACDREYRSNEIPNGEVKIPKGYEDLMSKLPRLDGISDDRKICEIIRDPDFTNLLIKRGLTHNQKRAVSAALATVHYRLIGNQSHPDVVDITVGEVRRMTDEQLLNWGEDENKVSPAGHIGNKKLVILRGLFGKSQ